MSKFGPEKQPQQSVPRQRGRKIVPRQGGRKILPIVRGAPLGADLSERLIISAFENPKYTWRTIGGAATEASVSPEQVLGVIDKYEGIFVRSTIPSKQGESLYTTRRHYRQTGTPWARLIGAFKNRIN